MWHLNILKSRAHKIQVHACDTSAQNSIHQWKNILAGGHFCSTCTDIVPWARGCDARPSLHAHSTFAHPLSSLLRSVSPPLIGHLTLDTHSLKLKGMFAFQIEYLSSHNNIRLILHTVNKINTFKQYKIWFLKDVTVKIKMVVLLGSCFKVTSQRRGDTSQCPFHPRLQSLKSQLNEGASVEQSWARMEGWARTHHSLMLTGPHAEQKCSCVTMVFHVTDTVMCARITFTRLDYMCFGLETN